MYGRQHRETNGVRLHHATYRAWRRRFPAQLVVAARERARALARARRAKKASRPKSRLGPIRYDARTYALRTAKGNVSLESVAGRLKMSFAADLICRKGRFWLHVVVTLPDVEFRPSGSVVGVDMGLSRPAVCSNNCFFGERRWKGIERRYFRLRRSLQRKGTRSAKRHLRKLAGKVNRFRRDCDHVLSRRIVDSVRPGTVVVVENSTGIRCRAKQRSREPRRRLHSWTFAQLRAFLSYKAEAKGCRVMGIDPRHTSQACSRCGHVHRSNRRSRSRFLCRACGFELNADLNAARNIARKHLAGGGMPAAGGPLSTGLSYRPAPAGEAQAPWL